MPEHLNDQIQDEVVKRQIDVLRLIRSEQDEATAIIDRSEAEIIAAISLALAAIDDKPTRANLTRLDALQRRLERIRASAFDEARQATQQTADDVAQVETQWSARVALGIAAITLPLLTVAARNRITTLIPFAGRTPEQWWSYAFGRDMQRIMSSVRAGIQNGATDREIISSIAGRRGITGVLEASRKDVQGVVGTVLVGTSERTKAASFQQDLRFDRVQWVSVLDSRTSTICRGLSGQVWSVDEPHPWPPAHEYGPCRSSLTFLLEGLDKPTDMTYEEWISRQPVEFQKEVLPKWQYEAWKDGTPLRAFVTKDLEPLTKAEFMRRAD